MKKRWIRILTGIFIGSLLLAGILYAVYRLSLDPYRETISQNQETQALDTLLTRKQAEEDLKYLITKLKYYHPAYVDGSDSLTTAVKKQYKKEVSQLDSQVTVLQLWQSAARITAVMKDGHTNVYPYYMSEKTLTGSDQDVSGLKLEAVNGIAVSKLYQTFCSQFSFELDSYAEYEFYHLLQWEDYLKFLNLDTSDGVDFTYQDNGSNITVHHSFDVPEEETASQTDQPSFVSYQLDQAHDAGIFTLTECNYNEEYHRVLEEFFNKVHEQNIKNVIVDLRSNGGGNSMVLNEFLSYLKTDSYYGYSCDIRFGPFLYKSKAGKVTNHRKEPVFDGSVYVLISSQTFSSATMFGTVISDNRLGTLVGEISGNMPCSYGDVLSFQLPHSKLCLGVSGKKWHRPDSKQDDQPLIPDVQVDAEDALTKVYELIGKE